CDSLSGGGAPPRNTRRRCDGLPRRRRRGMASEMPASRGSPSAGRTETEPILKGAEILLRRHMLVLVNDTAETITAQNADIIACRRGGNRPSWLRWRERQRAMGPVTIVVIAEHRNDPLNVVVVQNQQAVATF